LREFQRLFGGLRARVLSLDQAGVGITVEETGNTYEQNATLKAAGYAREGRQITIADDSGIEVDALRGAPGVKSATYTGPGQSDVQRTQRLLELVADVPARLRTARYRAVLAIARPGRGQEGVALFRGTCEGVIAQAPRGSNGFGYDPIFLVPSLGRTMAELSDLEKDAISHRGNAARAALPYLKKLLAGG
jgi:XTP/dITP diphosphohydrolase